jgi:uncharacterized protein YndB with AHSA1/START domain
MAGKNSGALQITLPSDREILMTRLFDAPPNLVFDAYTRPEHVVRWWACGDGYTMPVCEIDLRVGGAYRFVMRSPDGTEFPIKGVYREIAAPERLVHTHIYDVVPYSSEETVITMTFENRAGKTFYTSHSVYQTPQARDGHLESGMEAGLPPTMDRLEQVARSLIVPLGTDARDARQPERRP